MKTSYISPNIHLLFIEPVHWFADSGLAQGSGQDLTVVEVNPNDIF